MAKIISNKLSDKFLDIISPTVVGWAGLGLFNTIIVRTGLFERQRKQVIIHEKFHLIEQKKLGYFKWIYKYMTDKPFRDKQEDKAHRAAGER